MKRITKPQLQKLHILLRSLQFLDMKKEIIANYTANRTESSKELTFEEAKYIIQKLAEMDPVEVMREKVIRLAFKAGITYGHTTDDHKMNIAKINMFCRERGTVKKDIYSQSREELIKTFNQFKAIHKKRIGKEVAQAFDDAGKAIADLLNEVGLQVAE